MCSQPSGRSLNNLPTYFVECVASNMSDNYKMLVICKWIMGQVFYNDADVPLTLSLLKMVMKRAWTGNNNNVVRPLLVQSMEGLSPFLMFDLSKEEIAQPKNEEDLIVLASMVSVDDLRLQYKHKKISVPNGPKDFLLMLKRYTYFLFANFPEACPLFLLVKEVVRSIRDFLRKARQQMSVGTNGSILWIILLQSRHFALGKLDVLYKFSTIHSDLQAKRSVIQYSEFPAELLATLNATLLQDKIAN